MNITTSMSGEYQFTVLNADRTIARQSEWMPNLITNIGLDRFGQQAIYATICRIGTGTTAAVATDTTLVAQVASTNVTPSASQVNLGTPNYESRSSVTYEFAIGAVVGNMAEVGVGWATTGATLFSRALIVNGGGTPTPITVLVSEILQVTYRLTLFPSIADASGTVVISGVSYSYTARMYNILNVIDARMLQGAPYGQLEFPTAFTGGLAANTATTVSGTSAAMGLCTYSVYTVGNYYRDYQYVAGVNQGNLTGGIKTLGVRWKDTSDNVVTYYHQVEFTPAIPKTATNVLNLTMRLSWMRR